MTVKNKIDHIVIGANDLEQGVAFIKKKLNVILPKASKHADMSTHNCVAPTGNDSFIEILSVDPEAPTPPRARWFDMDNPAVVEKFKQSPCAYHWLVGTTDLDAVIANSPIPLGEVVKFSRGDRSWRLTIPTDGSLQENGLIPTFIEWSPGAHPSSGMADLGLELHEVVLTHPKPAWLIDILLKLNVAHLATVVAGKNKAINFNIAVNNQAPVQIS